MHSSCSTRIGIRNESCFVLWLFFVRSFVSELRILPCLSVVFLVFHVVDPEMNY